MDKWNAQEYRKNSQNQYRWGMELVSKTGVKTGDSVLDIGCGDGKITAEIAKKASGGKTVGLDSSAKMLKLGKKLFPASEYPNLSFKKADAQKFDVKGPFDLVFSNACLHWIKDQNKVLKNINKVLRPGGRIFFQMGGKGNAGIMNEIMDNMINNDEWKKYFKKFKGAYYFYSPEEYNVFLKKNGIQPVRVFLTPKVAVHEGATGLAAWVRTTWLPYTHMVPVKLRESFIGEAVNKYLTATKQIDNKIVQMKMIRLQVEAVKPF
jgi:trans-aconitate methyltransferase